jgi:hypothetical protein
LESQTEEKDIYLYLGKIYYEKEQVEKALEMYKKYRELGGRSIIENTQM